jgi:hypothetical protein
VNLLDELGDFGPNRQALQDLLRMAGAMSGEEICRLATAADLVTGYLGVRSSWRLAMTASAEAARSSGRSQAMAWAENAALESVMAAVFRCGPSTDENGRVLVQA